MLRAQIGWPPRPERFLSIPQTVCTPPSITWWTRSDPTSNCWASAKRCTEAHLLAAMGSEATNVAFIPTHRARTLPVDELSRLAPRSSSTKNYSYIPLSAQSLRDFDWLGVVRETGYQRGGPPLPEGGNSGND